MLTTRDPPYISSRNLNLTSHLAPGNTGLSSALMATNDTPALSACSTPTPTAKVFSQSSFFQERRAPALPSPAQIRALNEASGHCRAASLKHPPPVIVPSLGLAVKYGADVTIAEVEAQVLMRERLQGRVPVPEVFGWAEDGGQKFIYMSLVEGDTLQARFSTMNEGERQAVCKELRSMVDAWRALTQESDRYIGKLLYEGLPVSHLILHNYM